MHAFSAVRFEKAYSGWLVGWLVNLGKLFQNAIRKSQIEIGISRL